MSQNINDKKILKVVVKHYYRNNKNNWLILYSLFSKERNELVILGNS